jgi:hypothetical protein
MTDSSDDIRQRAFVEGADFAIIIGTDETTLLRLWRTKRGKFTPPKASDNPAVQLGIVTENLNRRWCEKNTGYASPGGGAWFIRCTVGWWPN